MMKNYIKVQNNGRYDFQVALQQAYVLISQKKNTSGSSLPDLPSLNRFLIKIQYGDKKVHVKVLVLNKSLLSDFITHFMIRFMHLLDDRFFFFFFSYPQPTVRPAAAYTAVNKKLPTFSCLFDSLLSSGVTAVIYLSPVVSRQANTAAQRQAILSRRLLPHFVAFVRLRPVVSSPWLDNIILP